MCRKGKNEVKGESKKVLCMIEAKRGVKWEMGSEISSIGVHQNKSLHMRGFKGRH